MNRAFRLLACLAPVFTIATVAYGASTVHVVEVASDVLDPRFSPSEVVVYTPDGYESSGLMYPVVYFLHGSGGWGMGYMGSLQSQADLTYTRGDADAFIVVAPNQNKWIREPTEALALHFYNEVMPTIENQFRVIRQRDGRGIVGHSKGGVEASMLGISAADRFSVIGTLAYNSTAPVFESLLTNYDDAAYPISFFIWHGRNDTIREMRHSEEVAGIIEQRGWELELMINDGNHFGWHVPTIRFLQFFSARASLPTALPTPTAVDVTGKLATSWGAMKGSI